MLRNLNHRRTTFHKAAFKRFVLVSKKAYKFPTKAYHHSHKILHRATDPLHQKLMAKNGRYAKWHLEPHHKKVHLTALGVYCAVVAAVLVGAFRPQLTRAAQSFQARWDRGVLNADYALGSVTASTDGTLPQLVSPGFGGSGAAVKSSIGNTLRYPISGNLSQQQGEINLKVQAPFNINGDVSSGNLSSGKLYSPQAIYYDTSSDYYYIADTANHRIVKTKIDGTGWATLGTPSYYGGGVGQFSSPQGIFYEASTEFIYILDSGNHRIVKTKIDGTGWTTYGSYGNSTNQFSSPQGFYYDAANSYFYIADTGNNRSIRTQWGGTGWTAYTGFNQPQGIFYDSANNWVYTSDTVNNRIYRQHADGSSGSEYRGGLISTPIIDLQSTYTINRAKVQGDANDVYRLDYSTDGSTWTSWYTANATGSGLTTRDSGTIGAVNARYIRIFPSGGDSYYSVSEVSIYRNDGSIISNGKPVSAGYTPPFGQLSLITDGTLATDGTGWNNSIYAVQLTALYYPQDVDYDSSSDTLYIADTYNNRIVKTKFDGTSAASLGTQGSGINQFSGPQNLFYDSSGYIHVADTSNHRIVKTKIDGTGWTAYGGIGWAKTGALNSPKQAVYDNASGYVYISDSGNNRIVKTKMDGSGWLSFGSSGSGVNQFSNPQGIFYDAASDFIYIADYNNKRIIKTKINGEGWSTFGGGGQFNNPVGVYYDAASSYVYVTDTSYNYGRILKFKMDGTGFAGFGSYGNGANQFSSPQAVYYDSATSYMYITDTNNNRVIKTQFDGTGWTAFGSGGSGVNQFSSPCGITYEPSTGYFYVMDYGNKRIVKSKIDGTGWATYGANGTNVGQFSSPAGIFYDVTSQYIFVADTGYLFGRVVRTKMDASTWMTIGVWGPNAGQAYNPNAMYYDKPSGYLYISDASNHRIIKSKMDGTGYTFYGNYGSGVGQLNGPIGVYYDSASDFVYVADQGNNRVVKFKMDGSDWATLGGFNQPRSVSYDSANGYLYVADGNNGRIVKTKFDGTGWTVYGFTNPNAVYFDSASGYLYVADTSNHRIVKSKPDGNGWQSYGVYGTVALNGSSAGYFNSPQGIVYDSATDYIYVSDTNNNRLVKTKIDGTDWTIYGSSGSGVNQFSYPQGLSKDTASGALSIADTNNGRIVNTQFGGTGWTVYGFTSLQATYYDQASGYLYVADTANHRFVKSKPDGTGWSTFGTYGSGVGQFNSPQGIYYDNASNYLYISDTSNNRIIKVRPDGTDWVNYGSSGSGVGRFSGPQSLLFDPATSYIYIADTGNHRIVKTQIDGTGWTTFGANGNGTNQFNSPQGLSWNSSTGDLYIADSSNNRIVKTQFGGTGWTTYGSGGSGTNQFNNPQSIYFDPATSYFYVADLSNNRIVKSQMGGTGWAVKTGMNQPQGITYDPVADHIFLADTNNNRLVQTKIDGTDWLVLGFCNPSATSIDTASNSVYIADGSNHRAVQMKTDGTAWVIFGSYGSGTNQFNNPQGIVYDSATGYIYLSDMANNRIVKTKMDGTGWTVKTGMNQPQGISYDPATESIFEADTNNHRIYKTKIDGTNSFALGVLNPRSVIFDSATNSIFVSDNSHHRVVNIKLDGSTPWAVVGGYGSGTGYFNSPQNIDYDPATGFIYVADMSNNRIVQVKIDGSGWASYANGFNQPQAVAADPATGIVYLADTSNHRIIQTKMDGSQFGIGFWNTGSSTGEKVIFKTSGVNPAYLSLSQFDGRMRFYISKDSNTQPGYLYSDPLVWSSGSWHTIRITYNSTTGVVVLYLDGTQVSTLTYAQWVSLNWGDNFYIGADQLDVAKAYAGPIDELELISLNTDTTAPADPTLSSSKDVAGGSNDLVASNWYNYPTPYFTWSATDSGGSNLKDYLVYFGTDANADPKIVGTAQSAATYSSAALTTSGIYHLRVVARDNAGNLSNTADLFSYKYDKDKPESPKIINVNPPGNSRNKDFTFSWDLNGDNAATDTGGSSLAGYQYRIKNAAGSFVADWSTTITDGSHSYSIPSDDYSFVGTDIFYLRAVDNAGNIDDTPVQNNFYYSSAVNAVQNLTVTPTGTSNTNDFTFTWTEPTSYPGLGYYYSVNVTPTSTNRRLIGSSPLPQDHYATQQGKNTLYIVAANGDITNYDSCSNISGNPLVDGCAKIEFFAVTPAPGAPRLPQSFDISNRDTQEYAVALKWSPPENQGTGFAGYDILRSTDENAGFDEYQNIGSATGTAFINDGLTKEQQYYYFIRSKDNTGQTSSVSDKIAIKPTGRFTSPPLLTNDTLKVYPKSFTAVVSWKTYRTGTTEANAGRSSSFVYYGTDKEHLGKENGGKTVGDPEKVEEHAVTLTGLEPSTTYYYQVMWEDIDGNQGKSDIYSFATKEKPQIANVIVNNITLTTATVSWQSVNMTNAKIQYCAGSSCQSVDQPSLASQTDHVIQLNSLSHSTEYNFRITNTDIDGNNIISDEYRFSTLTMPQIVGEVKMDQDKESPTTAYRFSWTTNIGTTSIVNYSNTEGKNLTQSSSEYVTEHNIKISDLADQNTYSFEVTGVDSHGNKVEKSYSSSIKTPLDSRPPKVSGLSIEVKASGFSASQKAQIIASWTTDEPASSWLEYGQGISSDNYPSKTSEDQTLTNNHVVIVGELEPSKIYHLRVGSKDAAGNAGYSADTTTITGKMQQSVIDIIITSLQKSLGWLFGLKFGN